MRAYLFGNGASIPYGSPLGADLFVGALSITYEAKNYEHDNRFFTLWRGINAILQRMDVLRGHLAWADLDSLDEGRFSNLLDRLGAPSYRMPTRHCRRGQSIRGFWT